MDLQVSLEETVCFIISQRMHGDNIKRKTMRIELVRTLARSKIIQKTCVDVSTDNASGPPRKEAVIDMGGLRGHANTPFEQPRRGGGAELKARVELPKRA